MYENLLTLFFQEVLVDIGVHHAHTWNVVVH